MTGALTIVSKRSHSSGDSRRRRSAAAREEADNRPVGDGTLESVVRVVITAGREAQRSGVSTSNEISAQAYRTLATSLINGTFTADTRWAVSAFARDLHGVERLEAMILRARQSGAEPPAEDVMLELLRAIASNIDGARQSSSKLVTALTSISAAMADESVYQECTAGICSVAGLTAVAMYGPGRETAHFAVRTVAGDSSVSFPPTIRIDGGFFANLLAGDTLLTRNDVESIKEVCVSEPLPAGLMAIPVRSSTGRVLGVFIGVSMIQAHFDDVTTGAVSQLVSVIDGVLTSSSVALRNSAALKALPQLATLVNDTDAVLADQLAQLAQITAESTYSDGAIIRIHDARTSTAEVVAAWSRTDELVPDVLGSGMDLGELGVDSVARAIESGVSEVSIVDIDSGATEWHPSTQRILDVFSVRSIVSIPIGTTSGRSGTLWITRCTNRVFDDADLACGRIIASHVQHILDRSVAAGQVHQAVDAAHSAIRLLGEALVAGVRVERTIRFIPRLFQEMFSCRSVRVWRHAGGSVSIAAGIGDSDIPEQPSCLQRAIVRPGVVVAEHSGDSFRYAIACELMRSEMLVIELIPHDTNQFGSGEITLVEDVADRIAEAINSAETAVSQQRQIERIRLLQNVIARAHEKLVPSHVVATVVDDVMNGYEADAGCLLLFENDGQLTAHANSGVPPQLVDAMRSARHWLPDADGDERSVAVVVAGLAESASLKSIHAEIAAAQINDWSMVCIPLSTRNQTIGCLVLLFDSNDVPAVVHEDLPTLFSFGEHIGTALLNAREHERERNIRDRTQQALVTERENSRQIRALNEVAQTFAVSLSLDETMRAVVEAMADRLDVDAVWIRTPDDRGEHLVLRSFHASYPELSVALERMVEMPLPRISPIAQHVTGFRQPVLLTESTIPEEFAADPVVVSLAPFLVGGGTIAVLPVATPNEVLGILTLLSMDETHALTNDRVEIANGVCNQAALALDNARLYQQQKHFADVIQESLLPSRLPQIPEIDLGVLYRSATGGGAEVGGDFYDFLPLDDGRLALVVGDVCGKGVAAAADTAMTKYIFRALAREHPSPGAFLRYANDVVCEEITPGKFVTLFYAVLDPRNSSVVCGNAGHPEPKLVEVKDGEIEITSMKPEGLALGILPDQDYEEQTFPFDVGSSIVVYTDGVVEARRDSRLYGQYRLERRLREEEGASAPQIAFAIYQDCEAYAEDGLGDDVAIVVAQRIPHIEHVADGEAGA